MIHFEERFSDSKLVERVWNSYSDYAGDFISLAVSHWEMVVTRLNGRTFMTVRGPGTKAVPAYCPAEGEWVAIRFKLGAFMPHLPTSKLVNGEINLPGTSSNAFCLHGSSWQFPNYENADTFVNRLVRQGLLVHEPIVDAVFNNQPQDISLRSAQRRFLRATGLTYSAAYQIERARYATGLLKNGISILDTVVQAGYFDQPHLTRSMKHLIGQTPAQLSGKGPSEQLSFLYKTPVFS